MWIATNEAVFIFSGSVKPIKRHISMAYNTLSYIIKAVSCLQDKVSFRTVVIDLWIILQLTCTTGPESMSAPISSLVPHMSSQNSFRMLAYNRTLANSLREQGRSWWNKNLPGSGIGESNWLDRSQSHCWGCLGVLALTRIFLDPLFAQAHLLLEWPSTTIGRIQQTMAPCNCGIRGIAPALLGLLAD